MEALKDQTFFGFENLSTHVEAKLCTNCRIIRPNLQKVLCQVHIRPNLQKVLSKMGIVNKEDTNE